MQFCGPEHCHFFMVQKAFQHFMMECYKNATHFAIPSCANGCQKFGFVGPFVLQYVEE